MAATNAHGWYSRHETRPETYSVLRLPARRTDPWTEIPIAGIRAGERKTC
jgi:hypothetical protein